MNTFIMTGTVTEINLALERKWGRLKVKGDDGREYVVIGLDEYLDIDTHLRSPGPDGRALDDGGHRWIGRKVKFEYIEANERLVIIHWL